jgi:SPP1 gp7 family putative phage head morphogenesis protein
MFSMDWWKTNTEALSFIFMDKNRYLWRKVWELVGARAFAAGYIRAHVKFGLAGKPPKYADIKNLRFPDARKYFDKRGLEFVKDLTSTDMDRLKQALKEGKGLSADAFSEKYGKDYSFSPQRLKRIYVNETHLSNRVAQVEAASTAGMETKTWSATGDESMCPICGKMNGQTRRIDKAYSNGEMVAHAHPGCRCVDLYHKKN